MKRRNPLAVFVLSIITFGIYDIYWLVKTKSVLNKETRHHTPSIWLLILPVPMIIVGYVLLFTTNKPTTSSTGYTTFNSSSTTHVAHPGELLLSFGLIFIGFILGLFISVFWFYRFSKAINEYTHEKMSTAVTFLILWLIHLIGIALIQDTFNDMLDNGTAYAQPNNMPPPNQNPVSQAPPTVQPSQSLNPPMQDVVAPTPQTAQPNQPIYPNNPDQNNQK